MEVAHGARGRQHWHLHDRRRKIGRVLSKTGILGSIPERPRCAGGCWRTRQSDPPPVGRELGLFGNPPGVDHISFAVADVDAMYATLQAAGVALGGPPEDQPWGARMIGLKDPDGNNLYLLQKL